MGLWAIAYLLDAIFLADTSTEIHKLKMANLDNKVSVDISESHRHRVIKIVVDVISLLPLELVAVLWYQDTWGDVMALCRMNRLLRATKIAACKLCLTFV